MLNTCHDSIVLSLSQALTLQRLLECLGLCVCGADQTAETDCSMLTVLLSTLGCFSLTTTSITSQSVLFTVMSLNSSHTISQSFRPLISWSFITVYLKSMMASLFVHLMVYSHCLFKPYRVIY